MCGIAGYININSKPVQDTCRIVSMLNIQHHRGPDDSGVRVFSLRSGKSVEPDHKESHIIDNIYEGVIGFNRLSILDLSYNGHQPMVSPDNKVLLSMNGEIYNAFDYKRDLEEWGYSFKSTSDTEIVLALYLKYGFEGMLNCLNGMFALVVIDLKLCEVLIARDRFGIKPMYFILAEDIFAFSSELKSFKYLENFTFRLDENQLDEYILFRSNVQETLFKDIQSLSPGHYLSYSHKIGLIKKRYFNLNDYSRSVKAIGDIGSYGEKVKELLGKSVESQLMSDVKLGCQLSGGIDSSLVTWLANIKSNKGTFEAVSITFNDQRFSEEKYINRVIEKLAITSHKFPLESDYYFDNFEKATWHLEAPINHPNTVAIYKLSQCAKEYVTVLLSGEGADEVFGGYRRFYDIGFPFRAKKLLFEISKNLTNPNYLSDYFDHEYRAIFATAFIRPQLAEKLKKGFRVEKATGNRKSLYSSLSGSLFDRQIKYEMLSYLPDLLIRQDKMSMAHSIENRVPFLDNELVENSFTIPEKYLLLRKSPEGYNTEKYLLKKVVAAPFGNDFAFRKKMGFGIPLKEFFMNGKFSEYLNEKILPGILERGFFNHKLVSGWLSDIRNISYNEIEALWVVISFEVWASLFLDNSYENRNTCH